MSTNAGREVLGRLVRETWVAWAQEQPEGQRKPSWLIPWTELDAGQREVDCRIGEAVAASVLRDLADDLATAGYDDAAGIVREASEAPGARL